MTLYKNDRPGPVIHFFNPSYSGLETERIIVQGQPRKNVSKTPSQQINRV
jgi:hypothetical protein